MSSARYNYDENNIATHACSVDVNKAPTITGEKHLELWNPGSSSHFNLSQELAQCKNIIKADGDKLGRVLAVKSHMELG